MKIYKVVRGASYRAVEEEIFFSSCDKALGYILGCMTENKEILRGYPKQEDNGWKAQWCYNKEILFNSKNWNKFKYVLNNGFGFFYIEQVEVF